MDAIVDLLRAIRERYAVAINKKGIHLGQEHDGRQGYCIHDHDLPLWFDATRSEILKLFNEICQEAKLKPLCFPRAKRFW